MKIAVDAMGGDHAPAVVVAGAVAEARETGTQIILVGIEDQVRAELAEAPRRSRAADRGGSCLGSGRDGRAHHGREGQEGLVDDGRHAPGEGGPRPGLCVAGQLRRGHGGCPVRPGTHPGCRAPGARQHLSCCPGAMSGHGHRRQRRLQARVPGAVCHHGRHLCQDACSAWPSRRLASSPTAKRPTRAAC